MCTNKGGGRSSGGGGSSLNVREGGGFQYTYNGKTYTIMQRNGYAYDVSDLADIPSRIGNGISASELAKRAVNNGREVKVLSPAQIKERQEQRRKEREARAGIDYELGAGVPWSNKDNRRAARQGRLATRAMRRR